MVLFGRKKEATNDEPKKKIIVQVRVSKVGQKLITVPKNTPIEDGDYVILTKLDAIPNTD
jgi:hypothetical protein